MKTKSTTYSSSAYQAFCAIDPGEYREKIRFVEKHLTILQNLEPLEYLEVIVTYNDSLFEIGKYHKQIQIADHLVALSMEYNIVEFQGRDIYFETLFKKAASLHNLLRLEEAIHILKELLKINPNHESSRLFLINCYVKANKDKIQPVRAISVACILLSAFVIAIELLLVIPFYSEYSEQVSSLRNTLFVLGLIILAGGEIWLRYSAVEKAYVFTKKASKKKKIRN